MGKKILVPCLGVIMIAFFSEKYTVKDHISDTKPEKGDHYYEPFRARALILIQVKYYVLPVLSV